MLVMEVEYLMGRVIASSADDRRVVEWPPHPARLFSALASALHECKLGAGVRAALQWLEAQPEPAIYANPPQHGGAARAVCDVFVPVNDPKHKTLAILPDKRLRQLRWFPAFTPTGKTVYFIWRAAELEPYIVEALQLAAEHVTYLGHSMSPVRVFVRCALPLAIQPTLIPDPEGKLLLRTPAPGRLAYLEERHRQRLDNEGLQPRLGRISAYRIAAAEPPVEIARSVFQHVFVLRCEHDRHLPLTGAFHLCGLLRKAVLECCPDPLPEIISGHRPDGAASAQAHLALMPLANIAHAQADGRIMGFALLLPKQATLAERQQLMQGLLALRTLRLGRWGEWRLCLLGAEALAGAARALQPSVYSEAHRHWASVTPVVFGHFPKPKPGKDVLAVIGRACRDIGLPAPAWAELVPASRFKAVPLAKSFIGEEFDRSAYLRGKLTAHVVLRFAEPVCGPIILGAGRFLGLGVCKPDRVREQADAR